MPFSGDPVNLLNGILEDIANIEKFTQGADRRVFEQNVQAGYAAKFHECPKQARQMAVDHRALWTISAGVEVR